MTTDELMFFQERLQAFVLYQALREKLFAIFPDITIKVQKSQIAFRAGYNFAFVSLRKIKGCPEIFLILSFGLSHRLDSPRIAVAVEPYPNRWTHHFILSREDQLDEELINWLREAHDFALAK